MLLQPVASLLLHSKGVAGLIPWLDRSRSL